LLHNNTTDIKPERHSTDTHGTNQVNFWILRVFGYQFAPRYRDLHKKIDGLIGFQHPKHYVDCLIKPGRKAYGELICKEWPNIQRIMASLAQKDVTQANIGAHARLVRSAESNQESVVGAGQSLPNALHPHLHRRRRTTAERSESANRGEAYHRFRRAISYVQRGKVPRED
jgi:TnpA family transposase